MKTINTKFRVVFIMLLGIGLLFTQNIATGQSRTRGDRTSNNREYHRTGDRNNRGYTRTGTRNDREFTRTGSKNNGDRNNNGQRYQHDEKKHQGKTYQNHGKHGNQKKYGNHGNHGKHQNHKTYNKHHKHHKKYNTGVSVYWSVPRHYYRNHWDYDVYHRKPWRHHHRPVVFHHRHGKAYYYDGYFYRYDNRYGYVVIEQPSHLIFTTVPSEFNRVSIHGGIYFRHRNIWMERTPRGYRLWRG